MTRLEVVIPTRGGGRPIARVLDLLGAQTAAPGSFGVTIVSDATDGSSVEARGALDERPFAARLLQSEVPGASAKRNVGWRAAQAPVVLFMDDDVLPDPGLVAAHLAVHEREPGESTGVLGALRWADELRVTPFMRWLETGIQFDYARIQGEEAGWWRLYTANVSIKRSLLERAGGFDQERLPFGYEDLDLGYRLDQLGFRLLYEPQARAEHLHAMDLQGWIERVRWIATSERAFITKHPELPPYFHGLFGSALEDPRGARLAAIAPLVPRATPWLGPRVAASVDLRYRRMLAPHFMEAWGS